MKVLVHTVGLKSEGGVKLLNEIKQNCPDGVYLFFISSRTGRINLINYIVSIYHIFKVEKEYDKVLYFSSIPPLFRHKSKTVYFFQNVLLINTGIWRSILKLNFSLFAKILFLKISKKYTDEYYVQGLSIKNNLKSFLKIKSAKIKSVPFYSSLPQIKKTKNKNHFIYISSPNKHKNNELIIEALKILENYGVSIVFKIFFSVLSDSEQRYLEKLKSQSSNLKVRFYINTKRAKVLENLVNSYALVYPSFGESLGLPLYEAHFYKVPVIASSNEYVRNTLNPVEVFDPSSPLSLARAICRFLDIKNELSPILERKKSIKCREDFFNELCS